MCDETSVGVCRCPGGFNGELLATFHFWWAEINVYYCGICDGLSLEIVSSNPERLPDRSLVDIFADLPGGRSVIVLDASWIGSMTDIVRGYLKDQHYQSET
jgi:hypothetical protein